MCFPVIFTIFADSKKITTVIDESTVIRTGHRNISIVLIIFHKTVIGIISPYHTVVIVTIHHHRVMGSEENDSASQ